MSQKFFHLKTTFNLQAIQLLKKNISHFFPLSFLGCVDKIGIGFTEESVATGYGAYIAQVRIHSALFFYSLWFYSKFLFFTSAATEKSSRG